MPLLSGTLDFLLCLVCVSIAVSAARARNDFLFSGFLWVAAAAFVGAFHLGGIESTAATHKWLSAVAGGPGTLAMGVGVLAAYFGQFRGSRWTAQVWSVLGAAAIYFLADSPSLKLVTTLLASVLLLALAMAAFEAAHRSQPRIAYAYLGAICLLLFIGFGLDQIPFAADGLIRRDDVLHVLLIACYALIWLGVRDARPA